MPYGNAKTQGYNDPVLASLIAGNTIINKQGLFIYFPTRGPGNLILSDSGVGGTDRFGNAYLGGTVNYFHTGGNYLALQTYQGAVTWYHALTEAGPWTASASLSQIVYSGSHSTTNISGDFSINDGMGVIWIAPSGDTTGVIDTTVINNAFSSFTTVRLHAGQYYVNASITPPTGSALIGPFPNQVDGAQAMGSGTLPVQSAVINLVTPFTGVAVIDMANSVAVQQGAQVIKDLSLNCVNAPAASGIAGIRGIGSIGGVFLEGVSVFRPDGPCLLIDIDAGSRVCDNWQVNRCNFSASRSDFNVRIVDLPDSWFTNTTAHDGQLGNWKVNASVNTKFIGCKGEGAHPTANAPNWYFTGLIAANQDVSLTDCTSQFGNGDGFLFDSSGAGSTALGTYRLVNCRSIADNQSGSAAGAGFKSNGCKSRIVLENCYTFGTTQVYGASELNVSFGMYLSDCLMQGSAGGGNNVTHDDATNTHALTSVNPIPF